MEDKQYHRVIVTVLLCLIRSLSSQQTKPRPPPLKEREGSCCGDCDRGRDRVSGVLSWSPRGGDEAEKRICQSGSGVWVRVL